MSESQRLPATVTDPGDPRVADFLHLTDSALRMRKDPADGLFIAEGALVVRRAVRAGYRLRSLLLLPSQVEALGELAAATGAPVLTADRALLRTVTGFDVHRGVLGSFERKPLPTLETVMTTCRRLLVLEDITSPTNLGAIARSGAALGMDGMLISPACADPLYRRALRVSMGEVLTLPWTRLAPWPAALDRLRRQGFRILGLTPRPEATSIVELGPTEGPVALLLGSEGPGLSKAALSRVDELVRIPMSRGVDSLNVAASAAVACFVVGAGAAAGAAGAGGRLPV